MLTSLSGRSPNPGVDKGHRGDTGIHGRRRTSEILCEQTLEIRCNAARTSHGVRLGRVRRFLLLPLPDGHADGYDHFGLSDAYGSSLGSFYPLQ